jgi:small-conductance mechanosensitive channel
MTEESPLLVSDLWQQLSPGVREALPGLLLSLALLAAGWVLAVALRRLARRGAAWIGRSLPIHLRPLPSGGLWLPNGVYWATLIVFALLALQALSPATFLTGLAFAETLVPRLVAALLIVASGLILGAMGRSLIQLATGSRGLARTGQYTAVAVAVVTAADQLGFQVTFLVVLGAVAAAALLGGLALGAGLGSRNLVADLVGAQYLQRTFGVGETVRVAGYEGRILEHTATGLLLDSPEGRVWVPGQYFNREPIVALREDQGERD